MRFEHKVERLRVEKHKGRETPEFLEDVRKMTEGEPLEYILGRVNFCGTIIDLSLRPMIPRPEAEFWLKEAIEEITERRAQNTDKHEKAEPFRALDLFSGSGCLGIALAKNIPSLKVDCAELKPELKEQIELSAKINGLEDRVCAITADIFSSRQDLEEKYDIITAVPPYVPPQMREEVMEQLHAEDPTYFFDREDGFYFHKEVLSKAKDYLNDEGVLYLEFDVTQREKIEELAKESGWKKHSFLKDPYGHDCVIKLEN